MKRHNYVGRSSSPWKCYILWSLGFVLWHLDLHICPLKAEENVSKNIQMINQIADS